MNKGEILRLYPKPGNRVRYFIGSVAMVAAAANLQLFPGSVTWKLKALVILGMLALAVVFAWLSYAYSVQGRLYLELNPTELVERNAFTFVRQRWDKIESFFVSAEDDGEVAAYRLYKRCRPRHQRWFKVNGQDGHVMDTYELDPKALADLLESWRLRYGHKTAAVRELIDDAI
jgi:hypothetical protein